MGYANLTHTEILGRMRFLEERVATTFKEIQEDLKELLFDYSRLVNEETPEGSVSSSLESLPPNPQAIIKNKQLTESPAKSVGNLSIPGHVPKGLMVESEGRSVRPRFVIPEGSESSIRQASPEEHPILKAIHTPHPIDLERGVMPIPAFRIDGLKSSGANGMGSQHSVASTASRKNRADELSSMSSSSLAYEPPVMSNMGFSRRGTGMRASIVHSLFLAPVINDVTTLTAGNGNYNAQPQASSGVSIASAAQSVSNIYEEINRNAESQRVLERDAHHSRSVRSSRHGTIDRKSITSAKAEKSKGLQTPRISSSQVDSRLSKVSSIDGGFKAWANRLKDRLDHIFVKDQDDREFVGIGDDTHADAGIVLHPLSVFKRMWNAMESTVLTLLMILLPLCLGYQEMAAYLRPFMAFTTVFFLIGIFIHIRTGYLSGGRVIVSRTKILRKYIRTWLAFDFVTIFPYVFVVDGLYPTSDPSAPGQPTSPNLMLARLVCLLNAAQCFKFILTPDDHKTTFASIGKYLRVNYNINSNFFESLRVIIAMAIYWHWSSCIRNFVNLQDSTISGTFFERYTFGFYCSVAEMLSAGFGALPPGTPSERWVTIFNMISSSILLAVLVGNISSVMIGLDSSGRKFRERIDEVNQYAAYKGLDPSAKQRVLEYYEFKYTNGKFFDENTILSDLNASIRKSICLHNSRQLIVNFAFFRDADETFINSVVTALRINHFLPGDYVIEVGTIGEEMYFIAVGFLDVITEGIVRARLSPGQMFGEIALLKGMMRRTASIRAVTPCVLYSLSKSDFDVILQHHPTQAEVIRKIAEERLENSKAVAEMEEKKRRDAAEQLSESELSSSRTSQIYESE
ncbi:uncharacterized protein BJ171DRAFT_600195 [Polychytrium aggregatum]|uniref:uncharacterized protein n=1 Tax=Polychytrium aggregatum TaxID=110093 RepID=UPI0022FEC7AB|nr:uncharacterized protein BJ171DRAFT_600195 [Polychytrium aggregatum]KAI9203342.1 hypothetical protein BJ171DRAFT_600195 [Polychytrium aggregatum]